MCQAFEETRAEGRAEGCAEGVEETRISSIRSLMKTMKLTADQAMDALCIPSEDQEKLHTLI